MAPQFSSFEFQEFAKDYSFKHTTTSPHCPKANGEVERAVQTVKRLWRKNDDKHLALLVAHKRTGTSGLGGGGDVLARKKLRNARKSGG